MSNDIMTLRNPRGPAKTYYNYLLTDKNTQEKTHYKTLQEITEKYNISRSNIYLMVRNPETVRRKFNDLKIEKVHIHYLVIEQNLDPSVIM
tara:strand:+ start:400 stop:672 length:273 start_codon:yes stop_codon:yes gene_type:complete